MGIDETKTTLFAICIADTFNKRKLLIKARFLEKDWNKISDLFRNFMSTNTQTDTQSAAKWKRKVQYFGDLDL